MSSEDNQSATSSARPVRVALFGCGRISRLSHLAVLRDHPGTELVAVADTNASALEIAAGHAPSAKAFDDIHGLLGEARPDAVLVALPTLFHREAALAVLSAGAHLYLEKPLAATVDDARAIHDAWLRTRVVGRIGFNARFNRLYLGLRDAIARGDIGQPMAARSAFTALFPGEATWRISPSSGGGALLELASHHVDLMRFLFGAEVKSASAVTWSNRGDDESAMLELTLDNGVHAQTLAAYGTIEEDSFEVYGTEGKLSVNRYDSLIVERLAPLASGGLASAAARLRAEVGAFGYGIEKRRSPAREPSFAASIHQFIAAVQDHSAAGPDLTDGLRAIEVIEAARRSAGERRVVELA